MADRETTLTSNVESAVDTSPVPLGDAVRTAALVVGLLLLFLAGVSGLGDGFKLLGRDVLQGFFAATANPLTALMVGLLATTLVQSSSVTTSMVVGLVAAPENPLPLANAVPMIMGANIGTTVTNTLVSMAHIGRKDEFRRAFAVATCHDFFNFMAVAVLLPLELATGVLEKTAHGLAAAIGPTGGIKYESPLSDVLDFLLIPVVALGQALFESAPLQGVVMIIASALLIFYALLTLVRVLRKKMHHRVKRAMQGAIGRSGMLAIGLGALVTMAVQSSSITTSLLVPLAGAGIITLQQAFPVTLGANIGTTVTAMLASLAASGENAGLGVTIAVVHVLFNVVGTTLIFPVAAVRRLPMRAAESLARVATESRRWALVYVLLLFYGVPAFFAFLDRLW